LCCPSVSGFERKILIKVVHPTKIEKKISIEKKILMKKGIHIVNLKKSNEKVYVTILPFIIYSI